jgi:cell volume regulation protein A
VAVPRADPNTRRIQLDLPGQLDYEMVGYRVTENSAALRGSALPGRVRLAMVVRAGEVLLAGDHGALRANDYAYFVAPAEQAPRMDWLFAEGAEAREAEQDAFGQFMLPGHVPLGELAAFYGLPIPRRFAGSTTTQVFGEHFDGQPQIGDRVVLGPAVLMVRSLDDTGVAQVGLRFAGVGERLISGANGVARR